MTQTTLRTTSFLRPYKAAPVPSGVSDVATVLLYLSSELRKLEQDSRILNLMAPQVATEAPPQQIEGMIRYAKSPWRPYAGMTTDGWVQRINGAWSKYTPSSP